MVKRRGKFMKRRATFQRTRGKSGKRRRVSRPVRRRIPVGLPGTYVTKLVYSDMITANCSLGTATVKSFRCNNLYDPDFAVGGHQPKYYDQLKVFYSNYHVLGSKITVTQINENGGAQPGSTIYFGIGKSSGIAGYEYTIFDSKTLPQLMEQEGVQRSVNPVSVNDKVNRSVRGFFSSRKTFRRYIGDDRLYGSTGSNGTAEVGPVLDARWHCWFVDPNTAAVPGWKFLVRIEYLVKFFDQTPSNVIAPS